MFTWEWDRYPSFLIQADNITLKNIIIDGSSLTVEHDRGGIVLHNSSNVRLENVCVLQTRGTGIAVVGDDGENINIAIKDSEVLGCKTVGSAKGFGIDIRHTDDVLVENTYAHDCEGSNFRTHASRNVTFSKCISEYNFASEGDCFDIYKTQHLEIELCTVRGVGDGKGTNGVVVYEDSADIRIVNSTFENVKSIVLRPTGSALAVSSVIISQNYFRNDEVSARLVVLAGSGTVKDVKITNNKFYEGYYGISTEETPTLQNITIRNNELLGSFSYQAIYVHDQVQSVDTFIIRDNLIRNARFHGILFQPSGGQYVIIGGNTFADISDIVYAVRVKNVPAIVLRNEFLGISQGFWYGIEVKNNYQQNSGTATFSGDGSTTQFAIEHDLVSTPSKVLVTPMSSDAAGDFYVTADATYIYVNYKTAPAAGTDNVKLSWYAEV